jgi:hypothetical protein
MDKFLLKKNIDNLDIKKKLIFKELIKIISDYENLIFLYKDNLKYKKNEIVVDSINSMKTSYEKIKTYSLIDYKKILFDVFLSDKKYLTLLEAIEFIKRR